MEKCEVILMQYLFIE